MAKKKEPLTPEERLQAALVPESEQPYKVPGNWCWTRMGVLLQSSKEKTDEFSDADLKYVGLEHMQKDGGIVAYESAEGVKSLKNVFHPQQILYGKLRPYLNKHDIATFDGVCSTDILVFNATSITTPKFANFFLNQDTFIEYAVSNSKGINLPRVSESVVLDAKCPLPPLPEQQRIVDRIESLFAKLDEAKQKAQDALDSFETRKAAILHKAFTGELTAQWRKAHGVGMESWDSKPLARITQNHDSERIPLSQAERSKLARVYDYYGASGIIDKVDRFLFEGRKLLIGEDGANLVTRSKPIAFIAEGQYWVNNHAHVLSTTSEILLDFLCHYINAIDLTPYVTGSAQPKMTQAKMNGIPIPVPTISEQAEIVRILDNLLAKEQQAKGIAEGVLGQIDLIKKAILARAFRGELGTNDPSEESAMELLKSVL